MTRTQDVLHDLINKTTPLRLIPQVMLLMCYTVLFQAFDSAQSAHELTLRNSELESHLKQHAGVIDSKVEQLESMENKLQRAMEEASTVKKRIDKYKNRESASIADEVLLEEIKTYKVRIIQLQL